MWVRSNLLKLMIFICVWSLLIILTVRLLIGEGSYRYGAHEESNKLLYLASMWNDLPLSDGTEEVVVNGIEELTEDELTAAFQQELPNVPFEFWNSRLNEQPMQKNATCAKSPDVMRLQFHNSYWQIYDSANVRFHLYGAYYDNRSSVEPGPVVRLLGLANTTSESFPPSYCQLWYEHRNEPEIVLVSMYSLIWNRFWILDQMHSYPHLLTCVLPEHVRSLVPQAVSLVAKECDTATNSLKVLYNPLKSNEKKQRVAVCVKGLDFPYGDMSTRLVEWLEMMRLLGVHKIFIYDLAVSANLSKVLQYYGQQGFVQAQPISLATGGPRLPHFQHSALRSDILNAYLNELIPYNDCFYRNMYQYDYLALLDIDEVIMPLGNLTTWSELIEIAEQQQQQPSYGNGCRHGFTSLCARQVLFPNSAPTVRSAPNYMHMLQHTLRVRNHSDFITSPKCMHSTAQVLTLHNHFCIDKLKSCAAFGFPTHQAQLQHYRNWVDVKQSEQEGKSLVQDRSIWRFRESLSYNSRSVLKELGFLHNDKKVNICCRS